MKGAKIFSAVLLILIISLPVLYFAAFNKVVLVSDISFATNISKAELLPFRLNLLKHFYRLKVMEADNLTLMDPQLLELYLQDLSKYDLLILTPVVTTFCKEYEINVSDMLENTFTIGITMNGCNLFDVTLDPSHMVVKQDSVDYRFRFTDSNAKTVTIPDFSASTEPYLNLKKPENGKLNGVLEYEERDVR